MLDKIKRLKEPSTWAGIGVLLTLTGLNITPDQWSALVNVGIAVAGALAVFLPEKLKD